jgi:hypothetical protein
MVSIPRDTRTEIIGKGFGDKINHAYSFGGIDMMVSEEERLRFSEVLKEQSPPSSLPCSNFRMSNFLIH